MESELRRHLAEMCSRSRALTRVLAPSYSPKTGDASAETLALRLRLCEASSRVLLEQTRARVVGRGSPPEPHPEEDDY